MHTMKQTAVQIRSKINLCYNILLTPMLVAFAPAKVFCVRKIILTVKRVNTIMLIIMNAKMIVRPHYKDFFVFGLAFFSFYIDLVNINLQFNPNKFSSNGDHCFTNHFSN